MPYCELQLGKRNLYPDINAKTGVLTNYKNYKNLKILKYVLSYADGKSNILDIANKTNFKLNEINKVVKFCVSRKLLKN
jgi:aminopeptidase-like protein